MTTTPAPTDLDFDPACSCRRCGKCDRALGELAKTRTYLAIEERSHGETIDDRDACHEAADKLAEAIAAAAGVDIGEHSNMNDPWANALDAMPKLVAELAEAKRKECSALCRDIEEDRDRLLHDLSEDFHADSRCGVEGPECPGCVLEKAREELATMTAVAKSNKSVTQNLAQELIKALSLLADYVDGEYPHARAKRLLADNLDINATTAEPANEPKATRCPVLHEDGVTRCHDDAGHAGDEHGGTGPHGHKTWTVS